MPYEVFDTAVKGLFNNIRKVTGRKFLILSMIFYALTAYTFSAAGFISAVASIFVLLYITFHAYPP